jgi:hypothetical protein
LAVIKDRRALAERGNVSPPNLHNHDVAAQLKARVRQWESGVAQRLVSTTGGRRHLLTI